jgi:hypothetical protein
MLKKKAEYEIIFSNRNIRRKRINLQKSKISALPLKNVFIRIPCVLKMGVIRIIQLDLAIKVHIADFMAE